MQNKEFKNFWDELKPLWQANIRHGLGNEYSLRGKVPASFDEFDKVTHLTLSESQELFLLAYFKNLKYLSLSGIKTLEEMTPLSSVYTLKELNLANTNISDISFLKPLINLRKLTISLTPVSNISVLPELPALTFLDISDTSLDSWEPLSDCKKLKELYVRNSKNVDIKILGSLTKLQILNINNVVFENFDFLKNLSKLEFISFGGAKLGIPYNTNISNDYTPLKKLPKLEQISCTHGIFEEIKSWFDRPMYYNVSFKGIPGNEWVVENGELYRLSDYTKMLSQRKKQLK
ncbi:MAG: hypothetical protein LBU84_01375 [Prevotella sp.]|jgi:hypothetical protein|nr:hypothetical protein [Prevotella sp.]